VLVYGEIIDEKTDEIRKDNCINGIIESRSWRREVGQLFSLIADF
jgi:hypothetical protein